MTRRQLFGRWITPAPGSIRTQKIGVAELAGGGYSIRLPAGPQVTSGGSTEHGRPPGVRSLALSPNLGGLQRLELQANELTDDAVAVLLESATLRGLEHLSLWHNRISSDGHKRLRERFGSRVAL